MEGVLKLNVEFSKKTFSKKSWVIQWGNVWAPLLRLFVVSGHIHNQGAPFWT